MASAPKNKRYMKSYEPIFHDNIQGVFVSTTIDPRKARTSSVLPISTRVMYQGRAWYYPTGIRASFDMYEKIRRALGEKGEYSKIKRQVEDGHEKVVSEVRSILKKESFDMELLKAALGKRTANQSHTDNTLSAWWERIALSKDKVGTRELYRTALRSFFKALGCTIERNGYQTIIKGRRANITPAAVTPAVIDEWRAWMTEQGVSVTAQGIYMRDLRAVLREAGKYVRVGCERVTIPQAPAKAREDDVLSVPDILRVKAYKGPEKKWADWWMILYLMNGSNLMDIALLEWSDAYFIDNELTFTRTKTKDSTGARRVRIPVIPELQEYLDTYASRPVVGKRVFPQVLLGAVTEVAIKNRVKDFNKDILHGMRNVCEELNKQAIAEAEATGTRPRLIRTARPSTARHSYVTTLRQHDISRDFIDEMVGHSDGKVIAHYEGRYSPKKLASRNRLLLIDPDEE